MHICNLKFLLFCLCFTFIASSLTAQETTTVENPSKIKELHISGNRITSSDIIKLYLHIDTGMVYDSVKLAEGKKRLKSTNLFEKIDIFSFLRAEGRYVYIIVNEKFYLYPSLSGIIYSRKYGWSEPWWRLTGGVEHTNFRGKMEDLKINFSIWDWKGVGAYWQKPLLPSRWYFATGSYFDSYPDRARNTDHTSISGKFTIGRNLLSNSKAALGVIPTFKCDINRYDKSHSQDTLKAYEIFGGIGWVTDCKNRSFDPSKGIYFSSELKTNYLHSGRNPAFIQFTSDIRLYHPGIFSNNKVVYRIATIFRNTSGGPLHRIQQGGEGSIRGYGADAFGLSILANNDIVLSTEYRFPIYTFPTIRVPILSKYSSYFTSVYYRIDGAFILDYGRLSNTFSDLLRLSNPRIESGTGLGFGLRLMLPTLERSICADFVWGDDPTTRKIDFKWPGMPHLYLDLYF